MKKLLIGIIAALIAMPVSAIDVLNGFSLGGGVKTGILIKNSDYTGKLGKLTHGDKYPLTLFFASEDNESYKGEGWLNLGYSAKEWGLNLSFWSHGNLKEFNDAVHLGDYYLWANLLDGRFRFIGGQGGGTPISTGGWLNADWLGYTGLRLFWVDPLGFSIGINFPDPDDGSKAKGIKPVTYLTMIRFGAGYRYEKFFVSLMFDNNPIYDDSKANYDGGLHRDPDADPIAQGGNIGFGLGLDNIFAGKGLLAFDGIVTNIGEEDNYSGGNKNYGISPIKTILALKAAYPIVDPVYVELKAKYTMSQGDNADYTASTTWGKLEIEPYASYQIIGNLKFEVSVNYAMYFNSYYLSQNISSPAAGYPNLSAGQNGPHSWAFDYYSGWQLTAEPAFVFSFAGAAMILGYKGEYSRDHVQNALFIDFRWAF